jgi:hypothetical protein
MSLKRHGLRILGLSLVAAFSLMAVGVVAAQAEEFTIEGKTFAELKIEEEEFEEVAVSEFYALKVAALNTTINCRLRTVDHPQSLLLRILGGRTHRLVLLTMCTVLDAAGNELPCTVREPIDLRLLARRVPHAGRFYEVFEPSEEGKELGTVEFEKGTGCALPLKLVMKGSFAAETEEGERVEQGLGYSAAINKLLETKLLVGVNEATTTGTTKMTLFGANKGKKWGYK